MANALMMRYAASRGNDRQEGNQQNERGMQGDYGRRNTYDQPGMNYNRYEESGMRQPNQYTRSEYDGGAESRYRGKDGRWKAGTRRSEYNQDMRMEYQGGDMNRQYDRRRAGGDDEEEGRKYKIEVLPSSNVVEWPYGAPDHERESNYRASRQIGFGAENRMNTMDHSQGHHMQRGSYAMDEPMPFDRETAEEWVAGMENEDKAHPRGGKWKPEMLKPLAQKYGIPTDGPRFWEFYAMVNAMYSDYSEVAKKFGVTSPDFYVCMAKAFMDDKDAEDDKVARYYEYIVKK